MRILLSALVVSASLVIWGCEKADTPSGAGKEELKANVPAGLFQKDKPANAKEVLEVKNSAKPGDVVVVRGRIAGGKDPFVSGRAIFTLADAKLPLCSEMAGDKCPTPWDLCCEPKDKLAEHTLTIEIDDASGKALTGTLQNVGGLAPGKSVVVKGKVTQKPSAQAMVISAETISVGS